MLSIFPSTFLSSRLRATMVRSAALSLVSVAAAAHAVVVRGHVTDAFGQPVAKAHVQLFEDGKEITGTYSDDNGFYEVRAADAGRFTVVTAAGGFLPAVGFDFYGGATDLIEQGVVLSPTTVRQEVSVTATGLPTPLPQLTAPVSVIPVDAFATAVGVTQAMRQTPGAFLVQTGQAGAVTSLFMRGGNSTANLVLVDGIPAEDVGGVFDYGTVSSTGVSQMEMYRGAASATFGTDAGAAVVTIDTPRGSTAKPVLNYLGEGGKLTEYRNELTLGGTARRIDYFGAFSRMDISNAVPMDRFHVGTEAVNLGYAFNGDTTARFTFRNGAAVQGVPGAWDFQGLSTSGRQADQDIYSGITVENRYHDNLHNLVRYGIVRKREQAQEFQPVGNYLAYDPGNYGPGYVGNTVTIRGANGYKATGQVQLYTGNNYDQASNRDQLYYQSDYAWSKHFNLLFGFRYDNERGVFNDYYSSGGYTAPPTHEKVQRTNFEYNLQLQGSFFDRLFYSVGGAIEKNHLYGLDGTPRLGIAYVAQRPAAGWFHGLRIRVNAATGVQEPTLALEESSLFDLTTPAQRTQFHIGPPSAERSRSYDVGYDQNIYGDKLVLKTGYFHNMFDRQLEALSAKALAQYFNIGTAPPCAPYTSPVNGICPLTTLYSAYMNTLAFQAEGFEAEVLWHALPPLVIRGGYTYLATRVVQSFSSDALAANAGTGNLNPNFPNTPIGAYGPLVGARPFRRAPHTGFIDAEYNRKKWMLAAKASMADRSDDSTFLEYSDLNGSNTLLLPNRDLDYGYVLLDVNGTYSLRKNLTVFSEFDNVLNNQHVGPIGYPGLPFTVRAGVKFRLGGE